MNFLLSPFKFTHLPLHCLANALAKIINRCPSSSIKFGNIECAYLPHSNFTLVIYIISNFTLVIHTNSNIYTYKFMATFPIIVNYWEQPECPSTADWLYFSSREFVVFKMTL